MEEKEYRQIVDRTFHSLERAFENVDPDVAEYEFSQGAVTITFKDGSRCILSTQPSVRQIWLAAASRGVAHHFGYDAAAGRWMDDKGKGVELLSYVRGLVRETTGLDLKL
jgi:CyaY protein